MKLKKMVLVPGVNNTEIEIFSNEKDYPFGFNATVNFKKGSPYEGYVGVYHNLTEVHWLYNKKMSKDFPTIEFLSVALESDIHGTGGTRKLKDIESIEIVPAKEKHEMW